MKTYKTHSLRQDIFIYKYNYFNFIYYIIKNNQVKALRIPT